MSAPHKYFLRSTVNSINETNAKNNLPKIDYVDTDTTQTTSPTAYNSWIQSPVKPELTSVPGIGKAGREVLEKIGITTTWQLIGKFLLYNRDGDKMLEWLSGFSIISSHKQTILKALADKVGILFGDLAT